jgi:hypothetical protein
MANEEKSVGSVGVLKDDKGNKIALNIPVKIERHYFDFLDTKTGKRIQGKKLQVEFDYLGEHFRLTIDKDDARLLQYMLKQEKFVILDAEDNVLDESVLPV